MNNKELFERIQKEQNNVNFNDFIKLVKAFGYVQLKKKVSGSHSHQFIHKTYPTSYLNLQPDGKEAKPFQIKQFLKQVKTYGLLLENEK